MRIDRRLVRGALAVALGVAAAVLPLQPAGADGPEATRIEFGSKALAIQPLGFTVSARILDSQGHQLYRTVSFYNASTGKLLCSGIALVGDFTPLDYAYCVVPLADAIPLLLGGSIKAVFIGGYGYQPSSATTNFLLLA